MGFDVDLPFFAYGMFKHGELGWLRIRDFVSRLERSAVVTGELLERDGLVILDVQASDSAPGMVVYFRANLALRG